MVEQLTETQLQPASQIRLPDVDEILDIGHAIYSADNPDTDEYDREIAIKQVNAFRDLEPIPNTVESPYLRAMLGVARGYARDLKRARKNWLHDLDLARERRKFREDQMRIGSMSKHWLGTLSKLMMPFILGLFGFIVAQVAGGSVSNELAAKTGTTLPSILLGLVFAFAGRYIGAWLYKRSWLQIRSAYETDIYLAEKDYEDAKRTAIEHWRQRGREEWEQYTGSEYPEKASYLMVMKADAAARQRRRDHDLLHDKTDIDRVKELVGIAIEVCSKTLKRRLRRAPAE